MERLTRVARWPFVVVALLVFAGLLTAASLATVEASVGREVRAALAEAGFTDVVLTGVAYRSVELTGPEADLEPAVALVGALSATRDVEYSAISASGGASTSVPPAVAAPESDASMDLRGSVDDGGVTFSGTVPNTITSDAILAAAADAFGNDRVADSLEMSGVEPTADVAAAAARLAGAMATIAENLVRGEIALTGSFLSVTGDVASAGAAEAIQVALAPDGVTDLDVVIPELTIYAAVAEGTISLSGVVPDDATRLALLESAARAFGADNVSDAVEVQRLAPTAAIDAALADLDIVLPLLATEIESAEVGLVDAGLSITGTAPSADALVRFEDGLDELTAVSVEFAVVLGPGAQAARDIERLLEEQGIAFEPGSEVLTEEGAAVLDDVAAILSVAFAADPSIELLIAGHTDDEGDDDANLALSLAQASAVRTYLIDSGIPGQGLTAVGYGETQPIGPNDTPETRELNRRIEFTVLEG
jgi:OOP family OmpA-OmpF porin